MGRSGVVFLMLVLPGWASTGLVDLPARGQDRAEELSDKERQQLEQQVEALHQQVVAHYQKGLYSEGTRLEEQALSLCRRLYPRARFPDGHSTLAGALNNMGALLEASGDYTRAEPYFRDALEMKRTLFPRAKYPDGHPNLATSLNNLGFLLTKGGEYARAEPFYREAVEMNRTLFPKAKYPAGHASLALSLSNLAMLLQNRGDYGQAELFSREALEMNRALYPRIKYLAGHTDLARSLNNMGSLLQARGDYTRAESFFREALEMKRLLYSRFWYPAGHFDLALGLNNLGLLLKERGELTRAEPFLRDALKMYRTLYPKAKYPDGHPDLATSLNNLGSLLQERGEALEAAQCYREALDMRRTLYSKARFPDGHPALAGSLNNLGHLLKERRELGHAEPFFREALEMYRTLYPKAKYPDGHPDLAISLNNLGSLRQAQGDGTEAERYFRDALKMSRTLYPGTKYPAGHPDLALSLNNLGLLLHERGNDSDAEPVCREALDMSQRLASLFADASAEAETLNYVYSQLPQSRDLFLSVSASLTGSSPADAYAVLWQGKAALARALERRQRLLRGRDDDDTRARLQELLDTRRQLAQLLLGLDRQEKDRDQQLQRLIRRKEDLEKKLAARLPELNAPQAPYTDLVDRLPDGSAFVDFHRHLHRGKGEKEWRPHYVAFVLGKGRPVRRVELGPAEPIEKALAAWRQAITEGLDSPASAELRRLVWDRLSEHLPDRPDSTVYLCPDGELSALPWPALPGRVRGTVLLEDHALTLVPHGPFLLQRLQQRDEGRPAGPGVLLAVGDLHYDKSAEPAHSAELADSRPANRGDKQGAWPALPGSGREMSQVIALAGGLSQPPQVQERTGTQGGPGQLLQDLSRARWAHLATHGFFAAPNSDVRKYLFDEKDFLRGVQGERVGAGSRSPLTQTGLALSGANIQSKEEGSEGGILTAEAIAGLDLGRLELAVLSACETGLGEAASGEGVFGLQRAFHLGGCRNVVASLWKVDDEHTAALMAVFYHQLWQQGCPPLEALRRAQLALYRHPQEAKGLARGRGPDFDQTVKRVTRPAPREEKPKGSAAVKDWAGFVLSGAGF
jgi:CHAT domain-containing protein/tetratricopeptide (TPR) repeat protein